MKIKFNWGTGIFLFLTLFVTACGIFIYFAFSQDVNLVHKEYYEKGVNYTDQMDMDARSVEFQNQVSVLEDLEKFTIKFAPELAPNIESGTVLFYYPAGSSHDILVNLDAENKTVSILKSDLLFGRYEVKINWISDELKYEVVKTIINK